MARKLEVEITGDASGLQRAFGQAGKSSSGLGRALGNLGKVAAVGVGAAFVGMAAVVKRGFGEIAEGQQVMAQTRAGLKSTGGAANVTAKQIENLATSISNMTGIDDEAVQASENMLLTFAKVRNEVGKGNDIFNQATTAVADMATRMNDGAVPSMEQLSQTSIRVGKALNDPIKGMGALGRVGVQFDDSQKKLITSMVKAGDTMGAQKLILAELTKEFGGSAKAAGETMPGQLSKLRNAFDEVAGQVASVFLPGLAAGAEGIAGWLQNISKAEGFKAKLSVAWEGIEGMARDLWAKIVSAVRAIDWSAVAQGIQSGIRSALSGLADLWSSITDAFDAINWAAVGQALSTGFQQALAFLGSIDYAGIIGETAGRIYNAFITLINSINWGAIGQAVGKFVTDFLNKIADFVNRTDWNKVGQQMVEGFKAAIKALAVFLAGVDWLAVLGATFRAAVAVIRGLFGLFLGIMKELGLTMLKGLGQGLVLLGPFLLEQMQKIPSALRSVAGQVPGWAKAIGLAVITGIGAGLIGLAGLWARTWLKIASAIAGAAGQAAGWAASIGQEIVSGILSGVGGLFGALKSKLEGTLRSVLSSLNPFSSVAHGGEIYIGKPLVEGAVKGINENAAKMKDALVAKVQEAVDKAKTAVEAARGTFGAAFGDLMSDALAAFDVKAGLIETKTERLLRIMDEAARKADLKGAIAAAQKELQAAQSAFSAITPQAGEDEAAFNQRLAEATAKIVAAQKSVDDALAAQRRFQLEKQALEERKKLDERLALRRKHFEDDLLGLQQYANNHALTAEQLNLRLLAIFKKYNVPFKKGANELGMALAEGLRESIVEVEKAAIAVRDAIMRYLSHIQVRINIDVTAPDRQTDGRQHGGPVRKGSAYIVGEAGPELFVPSSSGRIMANGSGSLSAMGGGVPIILNFNGPTVGTGREFEDTVRRALYDVSRRNPRLAI